MPMSSWGSGRRSSSALLTGLQITSLLLVPASAADAVHGLRLGNMRNSRVLSFFVTVKGAGGNGFSRGRGLSVNAFSDEVENDVCKRGKDGRRRPSELLEAIGEAARSGISVA